MMHAGLSCVVCGRVSSVLPLPLASLWLFNPKNELCAPPRRLLHPHQHKGAWRKRCIQLFSLKPCTRRVHGVMTADRTSHWNLGFQSDMRGRRKTCGACHLTRFERLRHCVWAGMQSIGFSLCLRVCVCVCLCVYVCVNWVLLNPNQPLIHSSLSYYVFAWILSNT